MGHYKKLKPHLYLFFLSLGTDGQEIFQQLTSAFELEYFSPFKLNSGIDEIRPGGLSTTPVFFDSAQVYLHQDEDPLWNRLLEEIVLRQVVVVIFCGLNRVEKSETLNYFSLCDSVLHYWEKKQKYAFKLHKKRFFQLEKIFEQKTNQVLASEYLNRKILLIGSWQDIKKWEKYLITRKYNNFFLTAAKTTLVLGINKEDAEGAIESAIVLDCSKLCLLRELAPKSLIGANVYITENGQKKHVLMRAYLSFEKMVANVFLAFTFSI